MGQLEEGDPQLQVKALRLGGDILWKLHREEEGVASFLRCLNVVSEAEDAGSEDRSGKGRQGDKGAGGGVTHGHDQRGAGYFRVRWVKDGAACLLCWLPWSCDRSPRIPFDAEEFFVACPTRTLPTPPKRGGRHQTARW